MPALLPFETQTAYRDEYRAARPGWLTSGDEFDLLVRRYLTAQTRVLDLGCGRTGGIERFWREARLAVGVDPDHDSLTGRDNGLPVLRSAGAHLPFRDEVFDMVVSVWVLEHLESPGAVFAEAARVLRPGGHFLFLTPNARNLLILANRVGQAAPWLQQRLVNDIYGRAKADTFAVRYRANTARRIRGLARRTGFSIRSLRFIADPTYVAFNRLIFRAAVLAERVLPPSLGVHILGDLVRD